MRVFDWFLVDLFFWNYIDILIMWPFPRPWISTNLGCWVDDLPSEASSESWNCFLNGICGVIWRIWMNMVCLLEFERSCCLYCRTLACSHDFATDIDRRDPYRNLCMCIMPSCSRRAQVFSAWAAPKHLTRISCLFNCVGVFHIWRTFHVPGEHSTSFLCVHPTKLQVMCLKLGRISTGHRLNQDEVLQSMRVVLPAWCLRYR